MVTGRVGCDVTVDIYLVPLELACQSRSDRIVAAALDCLQVSAGS